MNPKEILSLMVTIIGVFSFATIFTILYRSYATSSITEIMSGKRDIELMDEVIYEQQANVRKKKKITAIVKTVIFYSFLALVIPLFLFALINKIQGDVTVLGDKTIMVVASGSMSYKDEGNVFVNDKNLCSQYNMDNQFDQYDVIVLQRVEKPEQIQLYDVIAFRADNGTNVIHRIVKVEFMNGKYSYITQGDARPSSDGFNPSFDDVIGVYTSKRVKTIGMFIMFFQSYAGIITILSLVYCMFMIDRINSKIVDAENKRLAQLEDVIDYKEDESLDGAKTEFIETIYYKGFAYKFNESGFLDKEEIKKAEGDPSEEVIVKIIEKKDTDETITSVINLNETYGEEKND